MDVLAVVTRVALRVMVAVEPMRRVSTKADAPRPRLREVVMVDGEKNADGACEKARGGGTR